MCYQAVEFLLRAVFQESFGVKPTMEPALQVAERPLSSSALQLTTLRSQGATQT